jgi:hypothetical protein
MATDKLQELAEAEFNRDSFSWGDLKRAYRVNAIPFIYPFIPDPYQNYDSPPDFLCLPSPGVLEIPIRLHADAHFKLLYIKYLISGLPYSHAPCAPPFGPRYQGWPDVLKFHPHDTHLTFAGHVTAEVIANSQRDWYLYGDPQRPAGAIREVRIASIQAIPDGMGQIRTPFLLPKESTVTIKLRSPVNQPATAPNGYQVNGILFGLKIFK